MLAKVLINLSAAGEFSSLCGKYIHKSFSCNYEFIDLLHLDSSKFFEKYNQLQNLFYLSKKQVYILNKLIHFSLIINIPNCWLSETISELIFMPLYVAAN